MKFRHLIPPLILLSLGFVIQQYASYISLRGELRTLKKESTQLVTLIEKAMYEEGTITKQLKQAEQRHNRLRRLLPETLQQDEVEQQVATLAKKHHIKILATKTAINSKPGYGQATIDITLEAGYTPAKRFMRELKSIPRRIHIVPPEKRGKKSIHLSIIVYAVGSDTPQTFTPPHCVDMPGGLLLPPLQERLALLYADYSKQCHFVSNYAEHYLEQLRLLSLQKENTRLQTIEQQLRRRP